MQPVGCSTNIGVVNLRYDSVGSVQSLSPVLWFRLTITGKQKQPPAPATPLANDELVLSDIKAQLLLNNGFRVGTLISEKPLLILYSDYEQSFDLYLELDQHKLHQIEKFRNGSDLVLKMNIIFIMECRYNPRNKEMGSFNDIRIEIPKSEWVEKILPNIGFKDVSLIELPKINQQWQKIIGNINEAWHQHSMGKYDNVLIECRKALEAMVNEVKSKGFVKKGEEKQVPDWERFFDSDNMGDIIGTINKKFNGFLVPGAHSAKAINREDADFALLVTQGLVSLVTENLMKKPEE